MAISHWLNQVPFAREWAGRMLWPLLDFCYPGRCVCCEADCESDQPICQKCDDALAVLERAPYCHRCAAPLAMHDAPCPFCKNKGLYPFERIVRLGLYEDPLKSLIRRLKYGRRWGLGEYLAARLIQQEPVKTLMLETDRLIAVPLHWRRHFSRGFNQAQVVAGRLAKLCGKKVAKPAARVRDTESQTHYSATARHQNMKGAFALVKPSGIEGKHVVLIDDVKTSGATLQSLARELLPAKPASISAIILAAADPRGRGFQRV